jgi:hypothetical protein
VTRRGSVTMSVGGEAKSGRVEGEDTSWAHVNLTGLKNEENSRDRFSE